MLPKIFSIVKSISNYTSAIIIIGSALFSLLYDVPKYRRMGYIREVRFIKAISFSYMIIGISMFIISFIGRR
ncbi:MAG TPA: CLC_0170 family protein [Tissierellaceae bacterium]